MSDQTKKCPKPGCGKPLYFDSIVESWYCENTREHHESLARIAELEAENERLSGREADQRMAAGSAQTRIVELEQKAKVLAACMGIGPTICANEKPHEYREECLYCVAEKAQAHAAALREALEKLARLGNGDQYGNSIGNVIAQEALAATPEASLTSLRSALLASPEVDAIKRATLEEAWERMAKDTWLECLDDCKKRLLGPYAPEDERSEPGERSERRVKM